MNPKEEGGKEKKKKKRKNKLKKNKNQIHPSEAAQKSLQKASSKTQRADRKI